MPPFVYWSRSGTRTSVCQTKPVTSMIEMPFSSKAETEKVDDETDPEEPSASTDDSDHEDGDSDVNESEDSGS